MAISFNSATFLCLSLVMLDTSLALPKPYLTRYTDSNKNKPTPVSVHLNEKQPTDLSNSVNIFHKKINSSKSNNNDLALTIDTKIDRSIDLIDDKRSSNSIFQEEYVKLLSDVKELTNRQEKDSTLFDLLANNVAQSESNNIKKGSNDITPRVDKNSILNGANTNVDLSNDYRMISSRIKRYVNLIDVTKEKTIYGETSVKTSTPLPAEENIKNNPILTFVDVYKKTTEEYDNLHPSKDNTDTVLLNTDKVKANVKDSLKKPEKFNSDNGKIFPTNVRLCIHKFNHVAHAARVSTNSMDGSNYDYDGIEYGEYDEKEPEISNITLEDFGEVQVEHCARATDSCYAFWTEDLVSHQITILGQGCWESSDRHESCSSDACTSDRPPSRARPASKFCCCQDDLCNAKPISAPPNTAIVPLDKADLPHPVVNRRWTAFVFASLAMAILVIVAVVCKFRNKPTDKDAAIDNPELGNAGGPGFSCSATCVDNLKLHDNIGSGRYAKVWRGSLGGVPVAVKALPAARAPLWTRERDLYCLPHMTHSNLLLYLGCDTRPTLDGGLEHLLVLQLAPLGSLRQYLIDNTLEWDVYTKMALGVASALAHLHTHIDKDDQYKPCIVHRDVNSSNVVVRADLSCCLADLGLAMSLPDAKRRLPAAHQHRIHEAGTLRYLSPEALEGALDLRSCAAALRAVDVYALALVLWELLSRCGPLHRPPGPHPYEPPFRAEVGEQPTLEQMQVAVARHKARPLFSQRLVNTRGAKLAKDTCEDCWDHDAEARLTAVCVVERLSELKSLRPAPSPTINSNDLRPPTSTRDGNIVNQNHSPGTVIEDKNSNITSQISSNSSDLNADRIRPLQPHQGRNPCLERNLATAGPGDRLLIDKSLKDCLSTSNSISTVQSTSNTNGYGATMPEVRTLNSLQAAHDFSRLDSHANSAQNSSLLNRNQVSNDLRSTAVRPVTPLGYVQNDVGERDSHSTSNCNDYGYGYPAKQENNLKRRENDRRNDNGWSLKKLLDVKMFKRKNRGENVSSPLDTEVNLVLANGKPINCGPGKFRTSVVVEDSRSQSKIINRDAVSDRDLDRPSSLPGLDSVISMHDGQSTSNVNVLNSIDNNLKNINNYAMDINTCTVSPPNRTITSALAEGPRNNADKGFVMGFKELPNFNNGGLDVSATGSKSPGQIFAVIVPKPLYNGNRDSNPVSSNAVRKENNRLVSAVCEGTKNDKNRSNTSKRFSCDERIFNNVENRLFDIETSSSAPVKCDRNVQNRNSYSGEFEVGNFCTYNQDNDPCDTGSMIDYSSNSEDEHMLLLSENGGSKITMRQRFDVKPSEGKIKRRARQNVPNQDTGNVTKMATGSFTSLCNKYGPKNRYESFENECSERLLSNAGVNSYGVNDSSNFENKMVDISPINADVFKDSKKRKSSYSNKSDVLHSGVFKNGSNLSLCRSSIDDTSFINLESDFNQHSRNLDDTDQDSVFYSKNDIRNADVSNSTDEEDDITIKDDDISTIDISSSASDTKNSSTIKPLSIKQNLSRQHSLELVSEIFSSSSADLSRLKDPAGRIKTPGDVPPSVRRMRGTASASNSKVKRSGSQKEPSKTAKNRLSLYDDRMMFGNSL